MKVSSSGRTSKSLNCEKRKKIKEALFAWTCEKIESRQPADDGNDLQLVGSPDNKRRNRKKRKSLDPLPQRDGNISRKKKFSPRIKIASSSARSKSTVVDTAGGLTNDHESYQNYRGFEDSNFTASFEQTTILNDSAASNFDCDFNCATASSSPLVLGARKSRGAAPSDDSLNRTLNGSTRRSPKSNKKRSKFSDRVNINSSSSFGSDSAKYIKISDGVLIIINRDGAITLQGLTRLTVLHGKVEILGHSLDKNSAPVQLYSPRGTSLLFLKNITTDDDDDTSVSDRIRDLDIDLRFDCVVVCAKLELNNIAFIEKHMSQQIFPIIVGRRANSSLPQCLFEPKGNWNILNVHPEWDGIVDKITARSRVMLCGGKGVGKSTFLRYSINRLLLKFKAVRVIDLDPGQSEFTVPGCVSIVLVDGPLFGVNYTHLKRTQKSILSSVNPGHEPKQYILQVQHLMHDLNNDEELPTLINYMGYTHGLGINIVSAVIVHVQPTDIVQINSSTGGKNFKFPLNIQTVRENIDLLLPNAQTGDLDYRFYAIRSMSDLNEGWTLQARQVRETCILSYFGEMVDFQTKSLLSCKAPLYEIDLDSIKISNSNGEKISPAIVNANLVVLAALDNETVPTFRCFGWGIVRGIDLVANKLVLLTPETPDVLEKVDYLVFNNMSLPPSIYMTPDNLTGDIPYVNEGELVSFGQIPKRSFLPVKR